MHHPACVCRERRIYTVYLQYIDTGGGVKCKVPLEEEPPFGLRFSLMINGWNTELVITEMMPSAYSSASHRYVANLKERQAVGRRPLWRFWS